MAKRIQPHPHRWMIVLALVGVASGVAWAAEPQFEKDALIVVTAIDFDECDPVDIRSKIMEVHLQKGTMIVAEREIRAMNVANSGQRFKTAYLTIEGKPELHEAFRPGHYVRVKGVLHPDGYIAAFSVQKINAPVEKNFRYKPIDAGRTSPRKASATRTVP